MSDQFALKQEPPSPASETAGRDARSISNTLDILFKALSRSALPPSKPDWYNPQPSQGPGAITTSDNRADALLPPPPSYVPQPVNTAVQSIAGALGKVVSFPKRAMEQGVTTEEAIPWAADTALAGAGTAAGGAVPGAAGIFGGRLAQTADHAALKMAEEMQRRGLPREQIWDATGWFKGVDGHWRFEIPDDRLRVGAGYGTGLDGRAPIAHPDVAAAYPDRSETLSQIVRPSASGEARAVFYPLNANLPPTIKIEGGGAGWPRSAAAHELQHFVQDAEGFTGGGTVRQARAAIPEPYASTMAPDQLDSVAREVYMRLAGEVEARNVQTRLPMTPAERRHTYPWLTEDRPTNVQTTYKSALAHPAEAPSDKTLTGIRNRMAFFDNLSPEVREAIAGTKTDTKLEPWLKQGSPTETARLIRFNDDTQVMRNYMDRGMHAMLEILRRGTGSVKK